MKMNLMQGIRYIKLGLVLLLLFTMTVVTVACGSEPPLPKVTVDGKKVEVMQGSYCWKSFTGGKCVDMIGPKELIKHYDYKAPQVKPGSEVRINFGNKPSELSVSDLTETSKPITLKGSSSFQVSQQPGTYIYGIFSRWGQGKDASYIISVEVKQ